MEGWITLERKIMSWGWYTDVPTKTVFLHLLLNANHRANPWRGIVVERGQFVTGRKALADATGLSEKQVRLALDKLKKTEEIYIKTTNRFSIITICKYDFYQSVKNNEGPADGQQRANEGPADGQQRATNNNDNNDNNDKKFKKEEFEKVEKAVFSDEQYIDELQSINRGVDLKAAFKECYLHHIQSDMPPKETWQWRQKLNSWKKKSTDRKKYSNQYRKGQFVQ